MTTSLIFWLSIAVVVIIAIGTATVYFIIGAAKVTSYEAKLFEKEMKFHRYIQDTYKSKGYDKAFDLLSRHFPTTASKEAVIEKLDEILGLNI